jgi:enoyl-CoA hydratase/carnithine racemase
VEKGRKVTRTAALAAELELCLSAAGTPVNPLVTIELDRWRDAPAREIAAAARLVAESLPVTAGLLEGPPDPVLAPLTEAATLTLGAAGSPRFADASRPADQSVVWAGDVGLGWEEAVTGLRDAIAHSPRAAVACGQLVRQTAAIAPRTAVGTTAALAAEAAAYSVLLGGPEFARWLAGRGAPRRRTPPAEPVLVAREHDRLVITLHDPERRNAFSARMREALLDALAVAEADDAIKSVELHGSGPAFCAGGDLDEFGSAEDLCAAYLVRLARAPWRAIDRVAPKVTVYAHGACVGAGTEITAYAGRVAAEADAYFTLPEVRMGLVPGAGGTVSVPRRIGRWRAAWLMLTGARLPAPVALRWGLVDDIVTRQAP